MDAVDVDIENFSNNVTKLQILSQSLVKRGHFDSENINQQQAAVESRYGELRDLAAYRRKMLTDNMYLLQFLRETDELEAWMEEKEAVAASEDYGRDVEHVQVGVAQGITRQPSRILLYKWHQTITTLS